MVDVYVGFLILSACLHGFALLVLVARHELVPLQMLGVFIAWVVTTVAWPWAFFRLGRTIWEGVRHGHRDAVG